MRKALGKQRGRPRRIDREQIVQAAIELGLEDLTMRGLAERLGVHPTALNYHVENREQLVEAVATAVLEYPAQEWAPPEDADWRDWVRAFMSAERATLLANEKLAAYFRFPPGPTAGGLAQTDRLLKRLARAGFEGKSLALAKVFIAQVVFMAVRDELTYRAAGRHPQDVEFERKLAQMPEGSLAGVEMFLTGGGHENPEEQFAFDIECVIGGLEAQLRVK